MNPASLAKLKKELNTIMKKKIKKIKKNELVNKVYNFTKTKPIPKKINPMINKRKDKLKNPINQNGIKKIQEIYNKQMKSKTKKTKGQMILNARKEVNKQINEGKISPQNYLKWIKSQKIV